MRRSRALSLADTFNLGEGRGPVPCESLPGQQPEGAERQQERALFTVIVGNPPYSIGQKSATDENPNVAYPHLDQPDRGNLRGSQFQAGLKEIPV